MLQERKGCNGLGEVVPVKFPFIEDVVSLHMVLYHAAQLSQTGHQVVGRVIVEWGSWMRFVPMVSCGNEINQLCGLLGILLVFVGTVSSEVPRSPFAKAQHRQGTQDKGNGSNHYADGGKIVPCQPRQRLRHGRWGF